jgi:hypothetical protein
MHSQDYYQFMRTIILAALFAVGLDVSAQPMPPQPEPPIGFTPETSLDRLATANARGIDLNVTLAASLPLGCDVVVRPRVGFHVASGVDIRFVDGDHIDLMRAPQIATSPASSLRRSTRRASSGRRPDIAVCFQANDQADLRRRRQRSQR